MKLNLLYIAAESSNWVINLCNEFCELGHTITCVVQQTDEYDSSNPIKEHKNLKRINVDFKTFFNPTLLKSKLLTTLQTQKFDMVFGSHAPISPVIADIAKTFKLPWGVMLLDIPTDLMHEDRNRMRQWLYWFDVLKYADTILFNTFIARNEYEKFTHQFFTDDHVIAYATNMIKNYDNSGIDIKGDYVVSVSRLTPIKNCKLIPEALKVLDMNLGYVCIGRDRGELNIIKKICEENNINFKHYESISENKKYELIKNSSMLIYPQQTQYIGGLSPFEGMYCGKPILVSDYPILRDLYLNFASYFDSSSAEALAQKISYTHGLKRDLLKPFLEHANKHAKKIASFENMATLMIKQFEKVIKK